MRSDIAEEREYGEWLLSVSAALVGGDDGLVCHAVPAADVPHALIHFSRDAFTAARFAVLVADCPGTDGTVWSRSGRQDVGPFVARARSLGYGIAVLNTRTRADAEGRPIACARTSRDYIRYVWKRWLQRSAAQRIVFVAHRAASHDVIDLLDAERGARARIAALAFVDAHGGVAASVSADVRALLRRRALAFSLSADAPTGRALSRGPDWATLSGGAGSGADLLTPNDCSALVLAAVDTTAAMGSASCFVARCEARLWSRDPTYEVTQLALSAAGGARRAAESSAAAASAAAARIAAAPLPVLSAEEEGPVDAARRLLADGSISATEFAHIAETSSDFRARAHPSCASVPRGPRARTAADAPLAGQSCGAATSVEREELPRRAPVASPAAPTAPAPSPTVAVAAAPSTARAPVSAIASDAVLEAAPAAALASVLAATRATPAERRASIFGSRGPKVQHFRMACAARRASLRPEHPVEGIVLVCAARSRVVHAVLRRFTVATPSEILEPMHLYVGVDDEEVSRRPGRAGPISPPMRLPSPPSAHHSHAAARFPASIRAQVPLARYFFAALLADARAGRSKLLEQRDGGCLPRAAAGAGKCERQLEALGRLLLKCALDGTPALPHDIFAPTLWRQLLGDERVPEADVVAFDSGGGTAGDAGQRLLLERRAAFDALRRGFTVVDLSQALHTLTSWRDLAAALSVKRAPTLAL